MEGRESLGWVSLGLGGFERSDLSETGRIDSDEGLFLTDTWGVGVKDVGCSDFSWRICSFQLVRALDRL